MGGGAQHVRPGGAGRCAALLLQGLLRTAGRGGGFGAGRGQRGGRGGAAVRGQAALLLLRGGDTPLALV